MRGRSMLYEKRNSLSALLVENVKKLHVISVKRSFHVASIFYLIFSSALILKYRQTA